MKCKVRNLRMFVSITILNLKFRPFHPGNIHFDILILATQFALYCPMRECFIQMLAYSADPDKTDSYKQSDLINSPILVCFVH